MVATGGAGGSSPVSCSSAGAVTTYPTLPGATMSQAKVLPTQVLSRSAACSNRCVSMAWLRQAKTSPAVTPQGRQRGWA